MAADPQQDRVVRLVPVPNQDNLYTFKIENGPFEKLLERLTDCRTVTDIALVAGVILNELRNLN